MPFRSQKNREDFPDAFIWETILEILDKEKGPIHVVATDGGLYKTAAKTDGIIAHKTLKDFIDSPQCQASLTALKKHVVRTNLKRVTGSLADVFGKLELQFAANIGEELDGKDVFSNKIPNDTGDGRVFGVYETYEDLEFDFDNVEYYGEGEISIPFCAKIPDCTVTYAIQKGEYHMLDHSKQKRISVDDLTEHYYDAEEEFTVTVMGTLLVKLDLKKLSKDELHQKDLGVLFDSAEYRLAIDDVEI